MRFYLTKAPIQFAKLVSSNKKTCNNRESESERERHKEREREREGGRAGKEMHPYLFQ